MKYLVCLLLFIGCSSEPKFAGEDCVLLSDPFYSNYQTRGIVFKIDSYQKRGIFGDEISYLGCFHPFFEGPGCAHVEESDIKQTVTCPN